MGEFAGFGEIEDALGASRGDRGGAGEDVPALVEAIGRAAAHLQRGRKDAAGGTESEATGLARAIAAHAGHARFTVRQAVARAALDFPDEPFEAVIGPLLDDANQYVKRAAVGTYDERSRRARVERDQTEEAEGIRLLRAKIAGDGETDALRLADRLAELTAGHLVRGLVHEILKVAVPVRHSLIALGAEAARALGHASPLVAQAEETRAQVVLLLDLLTTARRQTEVTAPRFRDVLLREIVDEQVALLRGRVGPEGAERLRITLEVDAAATIEADRTLFGQALSNVLQNALEAYPAGGDTELRIAIRSETERGGARVALVVRDFGRGMDQVTLARLGEPYTSSKGPGRGLGVAYVKRMVEVVHGGRVEATTAAGEGTTVSLIVPRKQPHGEGAGKKRKARARN